MAEVKLYRVTFPLYVVASSREHIAEWMRTSSEVSELLDFEAHEITDEHGPVAKGGSIIPRVLPRDYAAHVAYDALQPDRGNLEIEDPYTVNDAIAVGFGGEGVRLTVCAAKGGAR